jgi:hypothetical protein
MIQIDVQPGASQEFTCVLGGQYVSVWLYQRGRRLYLDLWSGQNVVCRGAVCQYGADVLQSRSSHFSGTLHFYDFEGKAPPQHWGLGSRWAFLYVPEGEELKEYFRH